MALVSDRGILSDPREGRSCDYPQKRPNFRPSCRLAFPGRQSVNVGMDDQALTESLQSLTRLTPSELRALWPRWFDRLPPARLRRDLLVRALAYRMQARAHGGLTPATHKKLRVLAEAVKSRSTMNVGELPRLTPGTHVIREWRNERHQVTVEATGFVYRGQRYRTLSEIARHITGTRWSGPVFFGVKSAGRTSIAQGDRRT